MIIKYNIESSQIKFDINFYKKHYEDLQYLKNDDLINHYIKYGKRENCHFLFLPPKNLTKKQRPEGLKSSPTNLFMVYLTRHGPTFQS